MARCGTAGEVRFGWVERGKASLGMAWQARFGLLYSGSVGHGALR